MSRDASNETLGTDDCYHRVQKLLYWFAIINACPVYTGVSAAVATSKFHPTTLMVQYVWWCPSFRRLCWSCMLRCFIRHLSAMVTRSGAFSFETSEIARIMYNRDDQLDYNEDDRIVRMTISCWKKVTSEGLARSKNQSKSTRQAVQPMLSSPRNIMRSRTKSNNA